MNILIYDIETLKELFLVNIYIPAEDKTYEFMVHNWQNNSDGLIKFIDEHPDYYWVGYNNLRFDSQVVEWVYRNLHKWHELKGLEICSLIAQKAQDVIDDANYDVWADYREAELTCKQIDLFKINHYDNKNRMVSLKRLEFEMDLENIEEMPIHHTKTNMTIDEIMLVREYCRNDVHATYEFYKVTIGETSHPLYKENNQVQLRKDIEAEFGIPCLNYSDSKIGDEMIKKYYCEETCIKYENLPKKGTFRKNIKIKDCIASYIAFKTKPLKDFLTGIKSVTLGLQDDFKESIEFYGNTYTFAKGGLHTENKPEIFEADEEYDIIDWDVSSYYPAIGINNNRYPAHLGKEFLTGYKKMFNRRLELKPLSKKDKRIAGIVGALKLAVNSVYGKSSDMQSWLYDRQYTMFTTLTGELSLIMLIEAYELAGIRVISANTDGVTIKIHKSLLDKMHEINEWWSNLKGYELERTDYSKIIFSTVNDYIAVKTNGDVKKKGDFLTDFELHKNKSGRVVPIALEQYFINSTPVSDTINNHRNIYDFAMRQRANRDFHFEGVSEGRTRVYNKLIRYYVSKTGEKLLKIKNEDSTSGAANVSQVEAGEWVMTVCNHLTPSHPLDNINHSYYIERAEKIINKINYRGKKVPIVIKNQLSLF